MISILLATYNGENFIKQSINSILNQTFTDFELLIGFNGTTDNSKNIVAQYNDSRIKIFDYGDDKGKAKTLNKLIKEAKFDWIAIQDDDDVWLPNKLENQIKFLENFDIIGTQILYIDKESNLIGEVRLETKDSEIKFFSLNGKNQIANSSSLTRKKVIEEVNGWNENLFGVEDYDLWLKLIRKNCRFKNLDEILVLHRIHSGSNFNNNKKQQKDLEKILK
jgi:glycosyltransferase involved in cell wall biosynthesis